MTVPIQNSMPEPPALLGLTASELQALVTSLGQPAFRARQLAEWLYKKHASAFDTMTNLPEELRRRLAAEYAIGGREPARVQESADGTKKYLYPTRGHRYIESAWIPDRERSTLCVSSQVGCRMGCLFCMTAKQGFQMQLSAGEIINQFRSLPERDTVDNIVYMGMGEPLDNLDEVLKSLEILTTDWGFAMSPRRITVSTIGIVPAMRQFMERSHCHLAVSLHTPFEEERKRLMPIETAYPLRDVLAAIRAHDFERQRRISFEYILFKGLNDTPRHVRELVRVLHGIRCRINLIRFHPVPGVPFEPPDDATIESFLVALNGKGIRTTIRRSRGLDIAAACGLLSTRALMNPANADA